VPRLDQAVVDGRVLAFAVMLTLATGAIFGLAPALSSSKPDIQGSLKEGGRASSGSGSPRMRQTLVIVETALAVLLLVGAGLFINSLWHLQRVDPGFTGEDVLVVPLSLPDSRYALVDWQKTTRFYQRLVERVDALPGVRRAGAGYQHPLAGGWETSFQIEGVFEAPLGERPEARIRPVTPDYFRTAGIPLVAGRSFTDLDDEDAPGVVIINESFARTFFAEGSPIGHRILKEAWWPFQSGEWEIIGVVGDVKMDGLTSSTPWAMYFAHAQMPFNEMQLLVAAAGHSRGLTTQIRDAVWALDPQLPVENIQTLQQIRAKAVAPQRFRTLLLGGFAALAALLAAVGIYGILSYSVTQRVGEIGLRISLGASTRDVLRLVIRQGLRLSLVGLALGLLGALATTRLAAGLLFEVSPTDPTTFAAVAAGLTFVALIACTVPALRAARVDPMEALRAE
jgi:putative ABC transport system permease protein